MNFTLLDVALEMVNTVNNEDVLKIESIGSKRNPENFLLFNKKELMGSFTKTRDFCPSDELIVDAIELVLPLKGKHPKAYNSGFDFIENKLEMTDENVKKIKDQVKRIRANQQECVY